MKSFLLALSLFATTAPTVSPEVTIAASTVSVATTVPLSAPIDLPEGWQGMFGPALVGSLSNDEEIPTLRSDMPYPLRREYVNKYFADAPVLAKIAFCESTYRHSKPDGTVVRGKINTGDVGVMQINEGYHEKQATAMGLDLHVLEDNLAYARYLYDRQGTTPWQSSAKCWQ